MTVVTNTRQELAKQSATRRTHRRLRVCEIRSGSARMVNMGQSGSQATWPDLEESPVVSHD